MTEPPAFLDGARVLYFASLICLDPSGLSEHVVDGRPVADFAAVAVARYPEDERAYLFYCDDEWNVVSDMLWRNEQECIDRARAEYPGIVLKSGEGLQGDPPAAEAQSNPLIEEARAKLEAGHTVENLARQFADKGCGYGEILQALVSVGVSFGAAHQAARTVTQ